MKQFLLGVLLLLLLGVSTTHQTKVLSQRPTELKLGPILSPQFIRLFAAEHAATIAFHRVTQVMFYFGSFFDDSINRVQQVPEYASMYQHLIQAIKLDPYNMDAYYFAQAGFTWEVGRVNEVNRMLDYGMRYRTWDYLLPFYAGFNAAYFLKDFKQAAKYYQMAADRSGNKLFTKLAARYFHEAGQTQLGIYYLETMIKESADSKTRMIYAMRRDALLAIMTIEDAVTRFNEVYGKSPDVLKDLLDYGILTELPVDPYGGTFYIDEKGQVRTTSKFALIENAEAYGPLQE